MPRLVDYPHASLKASLEVANAVDFLGGSCSLASCAERLNKKISGAFRSLISSAIKHGLINVKKETLNTTPLYRTYKLAYSDEEKNETLRTLFLNPQLYQKIYERFKGRELPISMLDKLLIREFNVEDSYASRVSGYFVEGAKTVKLLENGKLLDDAGTVPVIDTEPETLEFVEREDKPIQEQRNITTVDAIQLDSNSYSIAIMGPGINSKIQINEEDDLLILDAMINKIKNKLKEGKS